MRPDPLVAAASLSAVAGLAHLGCIAFGGPWYRFFGAGERMARMAEAGHWYPTAITSAITAGALADTRKNRQVPVDLRNFTMLNLGSVAGLVAREFVQRGRLSLRFDPADLVATVVGAAVAQWAFRWQSVSAER